MQKKFFTFILLAGIIWGTSFPVVKFGLYFMDFLSILLFRFIIASISSFIGGSQTEPFFLDKLGHLTVQE
ncbi:MAG: EamA family transporter [Candidatus Helarchaeota archaeon]